MVFKLDGEVVEVNRIIDGKPIQFTNTFQEDVWVTKVVTEGSPPMTVLHFRKDDDLHVEETLGDLKIEDVWVKVTESE